MAMKVDDLGLNLRNLLNELAPVINKYHIIGIQLGINKDILKNIEKDYDEAVRRFSEVLSCWLDENGVSVSWNSLISALESPLVNNNKLVTTLRKKYITSREITSTPTQDSAYGTLQSQLSAAAENSDSVDLPSQSTTPVVSLPSVEPLFQLTEEGNVIDTPECVLKALEMLGFSEFQPGQEEAIMRTLSGVSTLVILPVGSGKSLCYQLPAYLYSQKRSPCITLVISPLISLMEDQVRNLPPLLKGECLHHNQTKIQQNDILQAIVKKKISVL